jgi:eukaryotic-like serine/threonine-protein kinase
MIGTKLAHYEITSHLGSGGMGDVYQATDTKLGRSVAIKLLPEAFTHDLERAARFEREARVLASLNHLHIAGIYGLEESGDRKFLVMELVGGETLAERIKRGPIPVDESLHIAKQICEALEAAHEKGIVHRDLKPANVKITVDGTVKVLDFGLAKAVENTTANPALSHSPTLSLAGTNAGVILGTASYMAPEQARGLVADHRSDVFALGCILYEMLTGSLAFQGETISDILASVLAREPDWTQLPPQLSPKVREFLTRCLEKNPKKRWQAVGDLRVELESILARPDALGVSESSTVAPKSSWQRAIPLIAAIGGAAVSAAVMMFLYAKPEAPAANRVQFTVQPDKMTLDFGIQEPAMSPDGHYLVFSDYGDGHRMLRLRSLDSTEARWLPGTEYARYPFWSPDSKFVAFYSGGMLRKMSVVGGSPETIATTPSNVAGSWGEDGTILFGASGIPLYRVKASGGVPAPLSKNDETIQVQPFPQLLPDGVHFLYRTEKGTYIGSVNSPNAVRILEGGSRVLYVNPGYLLTVRDGILLAYPFDPKNLRVTGDPVGIADQVRTALGNNYTSVSASATGILAFGAADSVPLQPTWYDRGGAKLAAIGAPDLFGQVRLSPDEKRAALEKMDARTNLWDIWLLELSTGVLSKFTVDPRSERDPIWSPDGQRVAYTSDRVGKIDISVKELGGGKETSLTETDTPELAEDWTKDGNGILFRNSPTGTSSLLLLPLMGDRKPVVLLAPAPFRRDEFNLSPDGRWIAYNSDESGRWEVWIASFPEFKNQRQVSNGGGAVPRWRKDGKELFYLALDAKLMAVDLKLGPTVEAGVPKLLFQTRISVNGQTDQYAVTGDGKRFLIPEPLESQNVPPITVITNWTSLLKRQ